KQLDGFLAKYSPAVAAQAREVLAAMRARLPGAVELVYDNYNALAIGFGPSERASAAIFSIALFPRGISLFLLQGEKLPDLSRRLEGKGKQAGHIRLAGVETLDDPAVQTLMAEALARARAPLDATNPSRLVIKSVSESQRPRRPAK